MDWENYTFGFFLSFHFVILIIFPGKTSCNACDALGDRLLGTSTSGSASKSRCCKGCPRSCATMPII